MGEQITLPSDPAAAARSLERLRHPENPVCELPRMRRRISTELPLTDDNQTRLIQALLAELHSVRTIVIVL